MTRIGKVVDVEVVAVGKRFGLASPNIRVFIGTLYSIVVPSTEQKALPSSYL